MDSTNDTARVVQPVVFPSLIESVYLPAKSLWNVGVEIFTVPSPTDIDKLLLLALQDYEGCLSVPGASTDELLLASSQHSGKSFIDLPSITFIP